jgi:uncharacterized protein
MSIAIVDAGPLLFLARLNRLELLRICADILYIPNAVLEEIDKKQDEATSSIKGFLNSWLFECTITNQDYINLLFGLGAGEREVMVQAYELQANWVVLDDQDARRAARRLGFKPIGTIGLLLVGKKQGIVNSVKSDLDQLVEYGFWVSDGLRKEALREAGEIE